MVTAWQRWAFPFGLSVVSLVPVMIPLATAHSIEVFAHDAIWPSSLYLLRSAMSQVDMLLYSANR